MMLQKECMIIRDLLSSYIEQLTNDTTTEVVEEHLQECKKCNEAYQELLFQYHEERRSQGKTEKRFLRRLKRYRYQVVGCILGIMLPFLLVVGWYGVTVWKNTHTTVPVVYTEDTKAYGEFENYRGISQLSLFPPKAQLADCGAEIVKYAYDCSEDKWYQNCQIYMECKYTTEQYQAEVERLKQVCCEETGMEVAYSEELFSYPAVYAMINSESCNEYALFLEEEKRIVYVYLQGVVDRRQLHFEEKYLPLEYGQNGVGFEGVEEFSIYPEDELWPE